MIGCVASEDSDRMPTAPVQVTVRYNGKPVDGAMVTFIPLGDKPTPANGLTNSEGIAKLFTYEAGDGAVLGTHKVQIVKQQLSTGGSEQAATDDPDYDPYAPPSKPPKPLIPQKYFSTASSSLTADVEKGKENEITFELTD